MASQACLHSYELLIWGFGLEWPGVCRERCRTEAGARVGPDGKQGTHPRFAKITIAVHSRPLWQGLHTGVAPRGGAQPSRQAAKEKQGPHPWKTISGTKIPWTWVSNRVENAEAYHTLRWEYAKDGSYASTADAGWVDDIVWIGDVPTPAITPDICTTANGGTQFKLSFWGERGIPYTVYSNATVGVTGWGPMDIEPQEMGETNGVFRFEATITPPAGQDSGFYRIKGGEKP